jgi:acetylornithine deacetylase
MGEYRMNEVSERIIAAAEARRAESIAFLRKLIALQRQGEAAVQQCFADHLRDTGCQVEALSYVPSDVKMRHEFAEGEAMAREERASIIARLSGTGGGPSLIFFGHPDGEPLKNTETWRHDPFAGDITDGRIHGWGVADDLAGIAIMAEAIKVIRAAGLQPKGDIIATSTPSKRHARGVAAAMQHGYVADAAIYVHPAESGVGMQEIKAICSGQLYFRVTVAGRGPDTKEPGHTAFAHFAVNALDKAMLVKAALDALDRARGTRVHHPGIESVVGRATNIMVSHIACGDAARFSRIPTSCVMGGAVSFPPGEAMEKVQQEITDCITACAQQDAWMKVIIDMILLV